MGSGTAVAREAADLVLGDDLFATLMYGLREGRRIVDNVQKGLIFLISTHVALLGFILIATIYGFGQPLLPLQILWLELFIDLSTSVAFEREPEEPGIMVRPPRDRRIPLLSNEILARIVGAGGFSAVAALVIMVTHPGTPEHARWLAYTTLVCAQVVRAYANRSLTVPLHRLGRNTLPAARRPARARDPGGDPVRAAVRRGVPRDAARARRLGRSSPSWRSRRPSSPRSCARSAGACGSPERRRRPSGTPRSAGRRRGLS